MTTSNRPCMWQRRSADGKRHCAGDVSGLTAIMVVKVEAGVPCGRRTVWQKEKVRLLFAVVCRGPSAIVE